MNREEIKNTAHYFIIIMLSLLVIIGTPILLVKLGNKGSVDTHQISGIPNEHHEHRIYTTEFTDDVENTIILQEWCIDCPNQPIYTHCTEYKIIFGSFSGGK